MALTHVRASEVATLAKEVAEDMKALLYKAKRLLTSNSNLSIDWAGDPKPSYLNEDVAGNLDGFRFTRSQLANLIGSVDQFRALMENGAVSQGDHLGNVNQVANVSE